VPARGEFAAIINTGAVENFNAYQLDISYDPAIIRVTGAEGGPGVTAGLIGATAIPVAIWSYQPANTPGKIRVLGIIPGNGSATGAGYLLQVHFQVTGTVGQTSSIAVSELMLFNYIAETIPSTIAGPQVVTVTAAP
jgi:hypothetical protein